LPFFSPLRIFQHGEYKILLPARLAVDRHWRGAQSTGIDYMPQRDRLIKRSCQPQEKARVELSIEQLEAFDPLSFSLNRDR
jgi:hypothetical protein